MPELSPKPLTHAGPRAAAMMSALANFVTSEEFEALPEFLEEQDFGSAVQVFIAGWQCGFEQALLNLEKGELQFRDPQSDFSMS